MNDKIKRPGVASTEAHKDSPVPGDDTRESDGWKAQRDDSDYGMSSRMYQALYRAQTEGGEVEDYLEDGGDLSEIAAALDGAVIGRRRIMCPSPGCDIDDRSMVVCIDPMRPEAFFVYACEGSYHEAGAMIRERLKLIAIPIRPPAERSAVAWRIWEQGKPADGTLVETYLKSRAITIPPPGALRFIRSLYHKPSGSSWPAMVALVTNPEDNPVAIHRTYLARTGQGKAPVEPNKMTLGPIGKCAIRLAPAADTLLVGEGIETCLSVMQETEKPAWSAISAVGLRQLVLPPIVREVIVLVDGDEAGEDASNDAADRWVQEGRCVRIARAPACKDFNDMLMETQLDE